MVTITTRKGQQIYVDDIDADLARYTWWMVKGYAVSYATTTPNHKRYIFMARIILARKLGRPLVKGETCDHIDLHRTNNQRYNLRIATHKEQMANKRKLKGKNKTSQYKGVSWHIGTQKWRGQIDVDKKKIYLGLFTNEIEAARAYDKAALQYFGQFARLNNV